MKDVFFFDGVSSSQFGLILTGAATEQVPQRDVESTSVPGRNGNLIVDCGRFNNVEVMYACAITCEFRSKYDALVKHLFSSKSYRRLEDTMHPDTYRMAIFKGPISPHMFPHGANGMFELIFDCKPQRFLKSGEQAIQIQNRQVIFNSWMPAFPLIQISGTGSGEIAVGSSTIEITNIPKAITIDSDTQNAYNGLSNLNNNIIVTGGFPVLETGETTIAFSGGITAIKITPRWWTL